jgi:hypothetical protein
MKLQLPFFLAVMLLLCAPESHAQKTGSKAEPLSNSNPISRKIEQFEKEKEKHSLLDQLYSRGVTMSQNLAGGLHEGAVKGLEKALPIAERIERLLPRKRQGAELMKRGVDRMMRFGSAMQRYKNSIPFRQVTKWGDHWGALFEIPSFAKSAMEHDPIGVAQKGTNILLGASIPTAAATWVAAGGAALGSAPLAVAAGTVLGAGLGAYAGMEIHNRVIKPVVDKVAEKIRETQEKARQEQAAETQAEELMQLAKAYLEGARALAADAEGELQQISRITMGGLDGSTMEKLRKGVRQARDACMNSVSPGVIKAQLERVRRMVTAVTQHRQKGVRRQTEVCALVKKMAGVSHPDALRIWDSTGQYLVKGVQQDAAIADDVGGELQQELDQLHQRIETAQGARAAASEAMVAISLYAAKIEAIAAQTGPGFSSILDKISRAEHKAAKARDLTSKALERLNDDPGKTTAGQLGLIKKYRVADLTAAMPDLTSLRQRVRAAEAEMDARREELNKKLAGDRAKILRWQGALMECIERDAVDGTMMAAVIQVTDEARVAVKKLQTTLAHARDCGLQAQALADGPLLNPGETQPQAPPLPELVAQVQSAIAACWIRQADDLIRQIRKHPDETADAEAARLDAELNRKIELRRNFQSRIDNLQALTRSGNTTRTKLLNAAKALIKAGKATQCDEDKATVKILVEKAKEASKVLTQANQATMANQIHRGQSAQRRQAQRRRQLADQMMTVLTTLQKSNRRSTVPSAEVIPSTGSGAGTDRTGRKPPVVHPPEVGGQSAQCIVDPSIHTMRDTSGQVYFIDVNNFGIGTGYKIISISEASVRQGFDKPPGMLGPYGSLNEAKAVVDRKCPESQRSQTGSIRR